MSPWSFQWYRSRSNGTTGTFVPTSAPDPCEEPGPTDGSLPLPPSLKYPHTNVISWNSFCCAKVIRTSSGSGKVSVGRWPAEFPVLWDPVLLLPCSWFGQGSSSLGVWSEPLSSQMLWSLQVVPCPPFALTQ